MTLSNVFFFLLVLACPVGMMLMMRGGGHGGHASGDTAGDPAVQNKRIADLEGEVARLRGGSDGAATPEQTLLAQRRR